jgi:hypothetical protein
MNTSQFLLPVTFFHKKLKHGSGVIKIKSEHETSSNIVQILAGPAVGHWHSSCKHARHGGPAQLIPSPRSDAVTPCHCSRAYYYVVGRYGDEHFRHHLFVHHSHLFSNVRPLPLTTNPNDPLPHPQHARQPCLRRQAAGAGGGPSARAQGAHMLC